MVFSPFREDFTDQTTLKLIFSLVDLVASSDCNEFAMLIFMNLAYWSSCEFSELLIKVMDSEKLLECFSNCLNFTLHAPNDPLRKNKLNFMLYFIGFLRNTLFERVDTDVLFFKHKHLYMTAIGLLLNLDREGKSDGKLTEYVLFLILNCATGKSAKGTLLSNQLVVEKMFRIFRERDEFPIVLSMSILKELIGYGIHGFKERIAILRQKNLAGEMKRLANTKNKHIADISKCITELIT